MRPRHLIAAAALLPAFACGTSDDTSAQTREGEVARIAGGEDWKTDFSERAVDLSEIVSGGPPKDGIPSIDDPSFTDVPGGDEWLDPRDPVMIVEHAGTARAYPLAVLMYHEIVNDEIEGRPLAVTYCPLCNTALVVDARVEGRTLDFGTTGRLRHSDLVVFDRQTETWWQQASGEAIIGELVGTTLEFVPANTLSWERAKELHPDLEVLSRDTGHDRRYGTNPYAGYDRAGSEPMGRFVTREPDPRLPAMERVAAVRLGDGWAAPFGELEGPRVANAEVEGTPFVVFWTSGAASAPDAREISEGRDVGMTAAYDRTVDGRILTFEWADGRWRDRETGSGWNLGGEAVAGPLEGTRLEKLQHGNHLWFAWAVFRPDTEIWTAGDGS